MEKCSLIQRITKMRHGFLSKKQRMPAPVELKSRLCRRRCAGPARAFADLAHDPFYARRSRDPCMVPCDAYLLRSSGHAQDVRCNQGHDAAVRRAEVAGSARPSC